MTKMWWITNDISQLLCNRICSHWASVWKTLQIFLNLKFRQMRKRSIN